MKKKTLVLSAALISAIFAGSNLAAQEVSADEFVAEAKALLERAVAGPSTAMWASM